MTRTRAAVAALVVVLGLIVGVLPAAARSALGVSPRLSEIEAAPGRAVTDTITVVNLSNQDQRVSATLANLQVDQAGNFSAAAGGSFPSASTWGFVEPSSLLLPAGHSQTVQVGLTPPPSTAPGGYYAAARFVSEPASGGEQQEFVHAILVEVTGRRALRSGGIASLTIPSRSIGATIPIRLVLRNSGSTHLSARGTIVVRDAFSRITARLAFPKTIVLPGTTRTILVSAPTPFGSWRVRVTASVSFGVGIPRDSAIATGYAAAWGTIAAAIAALLVLALLVRAIVRRRRRRRARRAGTPATVEPIAGGPLVVRSPDRPIGVSAEREPDDLLVHGEEDEFAEAALAPDLWAPEPVVPKESPPEEEPAPALLEPEPVEPSEPSEEPGEGSGPVETEVLEEPADAGAGEILELPPLTREPEPVVRKPGPGDTAERIAQALGPITDAEPEPKAPEPPPVPVSEPKQEPEAGPASEPVEEPTPAEPTPAEPTPAEPKKAAMPVPVVPMPATTPPPQPPSTVREPAKKASAPTPEREPEPERPSSVQHLLDRLKTESIAEVERPVHGEAALRRVRVAIAQLAAGHPGAGTSIRIDLIRSAASESETTRLVEEAYETARKAGKPDATAALALALAACGSPGAPEALLRAYATAQEPLVDPLRDALRGYDLGELRTHRSLMRAIPQNRRAALRRS